MINKDNNKKTDDLYARPMESVPPFNFDADVARVFPDMISRSIPGYEEIIDMIGLFARHYVRDGSNCYDLGASLGAASLSMRRNIHAKSVQMYAVDNSPAMLKHCCANIEWDRSTTPVKPVLADIESQQIENASMVVLNFTLQFVPPRRRLKVLKRIYRGLNPGGILILSEKLSFPESTDQARFLTARHLDFKRKNGYSDLEISQKRQSLENVLISNSASELHSMLEKAGFHRHYQWFQYLNFASFFASKRNAGASQRNAEKTND